MQSDIGAVAHHSGSHEGKLCGACVRRYAVTVAGIVIAALLPLWSEVDHRLKQRPSKYRGNEIVEE